MTRVMHMYTKEQENWLKKYDLPKQNDEPEMQDFLFDFEKEFPEVDPVPTTSALHSKARRLKRKETPPVQRKTPYKVFTKEMTDHLASLIGEQFTYESFTKFVQQFNIEFNNRFSEEKILKRLKQLTKQAGGSDKPIIHEEQPPEATTPQQPKQTATSDSEEKPRYMLSVTNENLNSAKTIWQGNEQPKCEIASSESTYYIMLDKQAIWNGKFYPNLWLSERIS